MSLKQNDEFKENVWDEFQEALMNGDTETCNNIIKATKAAGFSSLADQLEECITDDVTFEPYEHPVPPALEIGWQEEDSEQEELSEEGKEYEGRMLNSLDV